jgi:RHS repeat-associated protein
MGQISFLESRDNIGQLTAETVAGEPPGGPIAYAYDAAGRLTSATYGGPKLSYQYDAADRLTQITNSFGRQPVVSALAYDNGDQLQTLTRTQGSTVQQKIQFSYDANGNRIQATDQAGASTRYAYDQANRLTSYSGTSQAQYSYNGDGLRMARTVGGVVEPFTWDVAAQLPTVIQDGSTRYVTGPGGLPLEQVTSSGTVRYYHQDALGSTRALTNASGQIDSVYLYDPYGNTIISFSRSATPNPFQFAGQYTDAESGLQYLRARYYDPATAQFITRDPAYGLTGSTYSYASNSPTNNIDPSGLFDFGKIVRGAGVILHGAAQVVSKVGGALSTGLSIVAVGCGIVMAITLVGETVCGAIEAVALASGIAAFGADLILFAQHDPAINIPTLILDALGLIPGLAGIRNGKAMEGLLKSSRLVDEVSSLFQVALSEFRLGRLGRAIGGILDNLVALMRQEARNLIVRGIGLDLIGLGLSNAADSARGDVFAPARAC